MKLFISVDMEGTTGLERLEEIFRGLPGFKATAKPQHCQMMYESPRHSLAILNHLYIGTTKDLLKNRNLWLVRVNPFLMDFPVEPFV
jgi:hypothetical protein